MPNLKFVQCIHQLLSLCMYNIVNFALIKMADSQRHSSPETYGTAFDLPSGWLPPHVAILRFLDKKGG